MPVLKTVFALALVMCTSVHAATTSAACTDAQMKASNDFFTSDGKSRYRGHVVAAPKYCPTSDNVNHYTCNVDGADGAIHFMHTEIDNIRMAAVASEAAYEVPSSIRERAVAEGKARTGPPLIRWINPNDRGVLVSKIELPRVGELTYYIDTISKAVFTIHRREDRDGQRYIVAFKGSGLDLTQDLEDWLNNAAQAGLSQDDRLGLLLPIQIRLLLGPEFLRIPPVYMRAISVGQEVTRLLYESKQSCTASVLYTGHSLGGGLALFSALMAGQRCNQRDDSIVLLNAAMPGVLTSNETMLLNAHNSVSIVADINISEEFLQSVQIGKSDFLEKLAAKTQVVRFSEIGAGSRAAKIWRSSNPIDPLIRLGRSLNNHRIGVLTTPLNDLANEIEFPIPIKLKDRTAGKICRWYKPIKQPGIAPEQPRRQPWLEQPVKKSPYRRIGS